MASVNYEREFLKYCRAADGMAVTAEVWNEAHDFHNQILGLHIAANHGAGIVTGLEVVPSEDAANHEIIITPGVAVNSAGQIIVVPKPMKQELGPNTGTLYIALGYDESKVQTGQQASALEKRTYLVQVFQIIVRSHAPKAPAIELARIKRADVDAKIVAAKRIEAPQEHEIDLRYRPQLQVTYPTPINIGLLALGNVPEAHLDGWDNFAFEIRGTTGQNLWIHRHHGLDEDQLMGYDILCICSQARIEPSIQTQLLTLLKTYVEKGGIVIFESCRPQQRNFLASPDQAFRELLKSELNWESAGIGADQTLYRSPHRFAKPANGYLDRMASIYQVSDLPAGMVLITSGDYGCLWKDEKSSRLAIRDAVEWGSNLLAYALQSRR